MSLSGLLGESFVQERSTSPNNNTNPSNQTVFHFHVDFVPVPITKDTHTQYRNMTFKSKKIKQISRSSGCVTHHTGQGVLSWALKGQRWQCEARKEARCLALLAPLTKTILNLPYRLFAQVSHFTLKLPQEPQKEEAP